MIVRLETPANYAGIRRLNSLAFGRDEEGELVDRLRDEGLVEVSVVAIDPEIVGHALFSLLHVESDEGQIRAVALAPVAVLPARQRQGIGTTVIREGLRLCGQRGVEAVFVLGDPHYYARFGFRADFTSRLAGPFSGEHWMAIELADGILAKARGTVVYPNAFGLV